MSASPNLNRCEGSKLVCAYALQVLPARRVITDHGLPQASMAERPAALPPVTLGGARDAGPKISNQ
jgi:hypothetical protein